jgi:hypothetical protein
MNDGCSSSLRIRGFSCTQTARPHRLKRCYSNTRCFQPIPYIPAFEQCRVGTRESRGRLTPRNPRVPRAADESSAAPSRVVPSVDDAAGEHDLAQFDAVLAPRLSIRTLRFVLRFYLLACWTIVVIVVNFTMTGRIFGRRGVVGGDFCHFITPWLTFLFASMQLPVASVEFCLGSAGS